MNSLAVGFEQYIKSQKLAESSKKTILSMIQIFFNFCNDNKITEQSLNRNNVLDFLEHIRTLSNNTQLSCIQALRKLAAFMKNDSLMENISVSRDYSIQDTKTLNDKELKKLLTYLPSLLNTEAFKRENARNALAVKLILACKNFTIHDILHLKFDNFELQGDDCIITFKNKRFSLKASFIQDELKALEDYKDLKEGYIFVSKVKNLVSGLGLRYNILEVGKGADIKNLLPIRLKKTPFII